MLVDPVLGAVDVALGPADLAALEEVFPLGAAAGDRYLLQILARHHDTPPRA